jgi:hypothetical protein
MNELPLHPALVHIPLGVAAVLPLVAFALAGGWAAGWLPRRSWWLAVLLQAIVLGGGLWAQRTGEQDEEIAEDRVSEAVIEAHEEAAEGFVWASGALLLLMVAAGGLPKEGFARGLAVAGAVGSLATAGLGLRVGHAGGEIVYGQGGLTGASGAPAELARRPSDDEDDD